MATRGSSEWNDFYSQINGAALSRYPSLLQAWFPAGALNGSEFECGNINGSPGKSLKVNVRTGVWADFAGTEKGGDAIDLYAAMHHLKMGEAALALARELGIEPPRLQKVADSAWKPVTPIPASMVPIARLPAGQPAGEPGDAWLYLDADGRPLMYRCRFDQQGGGKVVVPLTWCENRETGERAWRWKDLPAPRPLYNLELLAKAPDARVLVVEGEKCADAGMDLLGAAGWVVVTWAGGAKRAGKKDTDWSPLKGRKVWIWPDNDDPGKSAALAISESLTPKPLIVRPDATWPEGHDIADLQAAGWNTARVLAYIDANSLPPDGGNALQLKRVPVDLSIQDLDIQTQSVWDAVKACNEPPSLLTSAFGLTIVDRDIFGRARQRVADPALLQNWLVTRMAFYRLAERGYQVSVHPSENLLTNIIVGAHPVPRLTRLAEVPVFTEDGRLIAQEGYDVASGVYYLPAPGLEQVETPARPDVADAAGALELIDDLMCDFPFVDDCDRAHALAFALLPIVRSVVRGPTPLFRFEAPSPGTGKSLLMRMLADLTCVVSEIAPPKKDEDWAKRITASIIKDPDAMLIDNAEEIESPDLKRLLTADFWEDRVLGVSKNLRCPVRAVFAVSLNNPLITRETMRRSLRVRLDARCEHPEQRDGWRHKSIGEYAKENRAALVAALVTIAQFGLQQGGMGDDLPTLGSYESFSRRMGAIMKVLGRLGFLGDRQDESALSNADVAAGMFVRAWGAATEERGGGGFFVRELVAIAADIEGFSLGRGDSDRAKQTTLGNWLSKRRGMVFSDWQIMEPQRDKLGTLWKVKKVSQVSSTAMSGETYET